MWEILNGKFTRNYGKGFMANNIKAITLQEKIDILVNIRNNYDIAIQRLTDELAELGEE